MLTLAGVDAGYGRAQVLFGVSFSVGAGETVALLGRNGMGKTTTVRAVMGLLPPWRGGISFAATALGGLPPHRIAQAGIGLVPEGRQVFPTLTVEENLRCVARPGAWAPAGVFGLFPRLAERRRARGHTLSGGEQQMLAIGRALVTNPRLLILDEATEGLAPLVRAEIFAALGVVRRQGGAVLIIDKNLAALRSLADRAVVLEKGRVVWHGAAALLDSATVVRHLQV